MIIICTIIIIMSSYPIISDIQEFQESKIENQKLIKDVVSKENKIDWKKLKTINKDIIGWIKIEDTNINYPILKDEESLKYLKYSYNKKYNSNGSIFTLDNKPFDKEITTIYGHNMKNKLMFSELSKYMDRDFLFLHQNFNIYTPKKDYRATVFSVYYLNENEERENIKKLDFYDEVKYYEENSRYKIGAISNRNIVKLTTCSYINSSRMTNQRYYIIATIEEIK